MFAQSLLDYSLLSWSLEGLTDLANSILNQLSVTSRGSHVVMAAVVVLLLIFWIRR